MVMTEQERAEEQAEAHKAIKRIAVLSARNQKSKKGFDQKAWNEARGLGALRCDMCEDFVFYTMVSEVPTGKGIQCKNGFYAKKFSICDTCYWRVRTVVEGK